MCVIGNAESVLYLWRSFPTKKYYLFYFWQKLPCYKEKKKRELFFESALFICLAKTKTLLYYIDKVVSIALFLAVMALLQVP